LTPITPLRPAEIHDHHKDLACISHEASDSRRSYSLSKK
jgi:hypothetical protein